MKRWTLIVLGVLTASCSFSVDPDKGRYSCDAAVDCGKGYECILQKGTDRGLCFKAGECEAFEKDCDGKDEDCNGVTDDVAWEGEACVTALPGVCVPGRRQCADKVASCEPKTPASAETCDGEDNDCDGQVDEDFDLANDNANCGACGHACPAGSECRFSLCAEVDCANGQDDDLDQNVDCFDSDCLSRACDLDGGRVCGLVPPSQLDAGVDPDAGTDLDAGSADAGVDVDAGMDADAGVDAGELPVPACVDPESACGDGVDNDGDGRTDCADPDCETLTCGDGGVCVSGACQ